MSLEQRHLLGSTRLAHDVENLGSTGGLPSTEKVWKAEWREDRLVAALWSFQNRCAVVFMRSMMDFNAHSDPGCLVAG